MYTLVSTKILVFHHLYIQASLCIWLLLAPCSGVLLWLRALLAPCSGISLWLRAQVIALAGLSLGRLFGSLRCGGVGRLYRMVVYLGCLYL